MKTFKLGNDDVYLDFNKYKITDNTAVQIICSNGEPYGMLTVNLRKLNDITLAYLNINLFGADVEKFVKENSLGEKIEGAELESGHLRYPLYRLNITEILRSSAFLKG